MLARSLTIDQVSSIYEDLFAEMEDRADKEAGFLKRKTIKVQTKNEKIRSLGTGAQGGRRTA